MTATAVMQGVRVLEVAEQTFVPAATALLADWGADIIKIEPTERGDAMRGLASSGVMPMTGDVHPLMEHSNRGKRSLALDLSTPEGVDILYKLAATCDVFLTNKLPRVRKKLKIEPADIRAHNPNIIYVAGTGQGERGPDADKGSYDALSFWYRAGVALGVKPADMEGYMPGPPGPGFGDSIGAMTIAGGIMGALFHRERTGEATTVDVSLLSSGMWAMGQAFALSLLLNQPWQGPPSNAPRLNPLVRNFVTKDERQLAFCCLQASRYWAELCKLVGPSRGRDRPPLRRSRRVDGEHKRRTGLDGGGVRRAHARASGGTGSPISAGSGASCRTRSKRRRSTRRLQRTATCRTARPREARRSSSSPHPSSSAASPRRLARSPEFNEHGDAILEEVGIDWDTIVDLKVRSVVG